MGKRKRGKHGGRKKRGKRAKKGLAQRKKIERWTNRHINIYQPPRARKFVSLGHTLPEKMRIIHTTWHTIAHSPAAGATSSLAFTCNSLFDAMEGTGFHQAHLRDKLFQLYSQARVNAARMIITGYNDSNADCVLQCVYSGTTSNPVGRWSENIVQKNSKNMYVQREGVSVVPNQQPCLKAYFKMPSHGDWAQAAGNDPSKQLNSAGVGPTHPFLVNLNTWNMNLSTAGACTYQVRLDQYTTYMARIRLADETDATNE